VKSRYKESVDVTIVLFIIPLQWNAPKFQNAIYEHINSNEKRARNYRNVVYSVPHVRITFYWPALNALSCVY